MIKAVIFDMDGVLIDSQPIHFEIDKACLLEQGVDISMEEVKKGAGTITKSRLQKWKDEFGLTENLDKLVNRREYLAFELFKTAGLGSIDGIKELLKELKNQGILMAVASSSPKEFIYWVLKTLEIEDYFQVVLSAEDATRSKPAPDIFLLAAKRLSAKPEECIVIEDSTNGVLAANAAGIKAIGYTNPNSGNQDLKSATLVIDDFRRLNVSLIQNI